MLELQNARNNLSLHLLQNLDIAGLSADVVVTNSALQVDGAPTVGDSSGAKPLENGSLAPPR